MPEEVATIPANRFVKEDFCIKDEIMYGKQNLHNTYLDKDYIEQCTTDIIKNHRAKVKANKMEKLSKFKGKFKSFTSAKKRQGFSKRKVNRLNNLYPKSVSKPKFQSKTGQKHTKSKIRNPVIDSSYFKSKKHVGRSKTANKKKGGRKFKKKGKNGLGSSLIKKAGGRFKH